MPTRESWRSHSALREWDHTMTSGRSSVARLRVITALAAISISFSLCWLRAATVSPDSERKAEAKLMSVPLSFEPNQGQASSTTQFLSRGSGYALLLAPGEVTLNLERQRPARPTGTLRMSLIGANPEANSVGADRQPGVVSYLIGNDPKNWRYRHPDLWPGPLSPDLPWSGPGLLRESATVGV